MSSYKIAYGTGKTKVKLNARYMGKDLQISIVGGKAHIGAVALAVPCTKNKEGVNASCSVMTVPGHRDNIPAEAVALKVCKALGCVASVSVGLHIDNASQSEITELVSNSNRAIEILIEKIGGA